MNIVVCIKPIPDSSVIALDSATGLLNADDLVYMIDACDIAAVEEAVKIKERMDDCRVILVSLAPPSTERLMRLCMAMGADDVVPVWDDTLGDADSYTAGVILSAAIAPIEPALILCGQKATDTQVGLAGYVIADGLNFPVISRVTEINAADGAAAVVVERKLEKGRMEKVECELPTVLTLETDLTEPRYAALPDLLAALRHEIVYLDLKALGLTAKETGKEAARTVTISLSLPKPRPKKVFTPDSQLSAQERRRLILSGGAAKKKQQSDYLEGDPDNIAETVIRFLGDKNLL